MPELEVVGASSVGLMNVLGKEGDTKIMWDRNNQDEVAVARKAFADLRAKNFTAYRAEGKDGTKGALLTEFDPNAERIIMAPRVAGGA